MIVCETHVYIISRKQCVNIEIPIYSLHSDIDHAILLAECEINLLKQ